MRLRSGITCGICGCPPVLGSRIKRESLLARPADLYVINRENVEWLVDYYRNDWPFDMVVIDEATASKGPER